MVMVDEPGHEASAGQVLNAISSIETRMRSFEQYYDATLMEQAQRLEGVDKHMSVMKSVLRDLRSLEVR